MLKLVPSRNPPGYQISHAFPMLPPVIILFPVLGSLVGSVSLLLTLEMYVIRGLAGGKTFRNQGLARIFLKPAVASLQWLNGHLILFMLHWFPLGAEKGFGTEPLNVLWRDHNKHRSCHFLGIFGNSQWKLVVFFFSYIYSFNALWVKWLGNKHPLISVSAGKWKYHCCCDLAFIQHLTIHFIVQFKREPEITPVKFCLVWFREKDVCKTGPSMMWKNSDPSKD